MIADLQSERMDEQRAQLPGLVTSRNGVPHSPINSHPRGRDDPAPDDAFLDMLMRCQGSRLEEQRSELPRTNVTSDAEQPTVNRRGRSPAANNAGATVPDEDFFSLIMRVQGGRMEDQRAAVSKPHLFHFNSDSRFLVNPF